MGYKVSIVIPVYNGANYMREAIDSALNQTYKDKEIIVVNDGSNDGGETHDIALSYGNKIRYFEKENGGVSTALNLAIDNMTGDYFSWLSHDDKYYPDKLEKQISEIKKYDDHTILYSNYDLIDGDGIKYDTIYQDHVMLTKNPDNAVLRGAICGVTLLIPKKAFKEVGQFSVEYRCVQDYLKWFEMLLKNYKFVHMEDVLASSRVHKNQVTYTSPKMISEGNWIWTHIAEEYPIDRMLKYEGNEYLFYYKYKNYLLKGPYKEAIQNVSSMANKYFIKAKSEVSKSTMTVIVIDNGIKEDVEKTIKSLQKQSYNKLEILIEGKTKVNKIKNYESREDILRNIKSDFYSFLNAGIEVKEEWLDEEITISYLTNKALVISDYPHYEHRELVDNYASLLTTLDGVIINSKYRPKYEYDYKFLYEIAKKGGAFIVDKNYLINRTISYNITDAYNYLELVIKDGLASPYDLAILNYDLAVIFNKYANNPNKVYMYEPCNELKELSFSRSFQLLKKYIDKKKNKKKL